MAAGYPASRAARAAPASQRPHVEPLDDLAMEEACPLSRQVSPKCRLIDGVAPSPTCADKPDDARFEFPEFQRRAGVLADEFFLSRDIEGMVASVRGLGCQAFHDELAAVLLRKSLDKGKEERQAVVPFLAALTEAELMSAAQLTRGFEKLVLSWNDLKLDVPMAPGMLAAFLSHRVGLLDSSLFARLPEDLLRSVCGGLPDGQIHQTVQAHLEDLTDFKAAVTTRLEEDLFRERNVDAFAAWLRTKAKPAFHHEVVLAACLGSFGATPSASAGAFWTSCFDGDGDALRGEKIRLVLALMDQLHEAGYEEEEALLSEVDLQLGFSRLLVAAARMPTDPAHPESNRDHLARLLQGAVEREILSAQFLKIARRLRYGGSWAVDALRQAQRHTPMHSRRVWGSGDARHFRTEVNDAISEYFDSRSVEELAHVVQELHLSTKEQASFLRKLLVAGMERGEQEITLAAMSGLLGYCWSEREVASAFDELRDVAPDLVLDFPLCREQTRTLMVAAERQGLLDHAYLLHDGATIV